MAGTRMQTIKGAVKRLKDITVIDLNKLGVRDCRNLLNALPIVLKQVEDELKRRATAPAAQP